MVSQSYARPRVTQEEAQRKRLAGGSPGQPPHHYPPRHTTRTMTRHRTPEETTI